jgi:flagellar P-ring protein FlgI
MTTATHARHAATPHPDPAARGRIALLRGILAVAAAILSLCAAPASAERIKNLADIHGVRANSLIGYGVVVGLDGTGDQTTQTPFTVQSLTSMLNQLGVTLPPGTQLQLKNVAAVMVTADLPAFAQPGQTIDVTVSSMGNAQSLRGGTLLMTPLKGADGQVYAMAQGNLLIGGAGGGGGGSKTVINHLSAGRITGGATVERAVPSVMGQNGVVRIQLRTSDFGTVRRMAEAINARFAAGLASAVDGRVVEVRVPSDADQRVAFLADLEDIDVNPAEATARVVINARTGSIVMNSYVTIGRCAVAHGNLQVTISSDPVISQPNALAGGQTVATQKSTVDIKKDKGELVNLPAGTSLGDVVKALNAIGATPQDLLAILQAMKAAGALRAELEII